MKKTIFILITILAATASFAQDASNDSIRKRIREMKLSEEYVYAESGSITDFAEAKPAASEKLHAAAITLMTEHQKGKEELKSIWAKAEKQMLFMEYNNGALFKVFAYLPKSSLIEMQPKAENGYERRDNLPTYNRPQRTDCRRLLGGHVVGCRKRQPYSHCGTADRTDRYDYSARLKCAERKSLQRR